MHRSCLSGIVAEMPLSMAHDAGHGGDDYYGWREVGVCFFGGLQEGQEGYGCEVDGRDVGVEGSGPFGEGFGVEEAFF